MTKTSFPKSLVPSQVKNSIFIFFDLKGRRSKLDQQGLKDAVSIERPAVHSNLVRNALIRQYHYENKVNHHYPLIL